MYHKLEQLYAKMDADAERLLIEERGKALMKTLRAKRRKARRLSNRYKVGACGFKTKQFIHRHKAIAYYKELKNKEAQPYITALEAMVTVRTSLARMEIKPDLSFFRSLPDGDSMPILLPVVVQDDKAARVPSILTKRKRILPVIPEHQQMLASFMVWLLVLGTVSYSSTVAALTN